MKVALDWLNTYCAWTWSVDELVERLTMSGTEVEDIQTKGVADEKIITARIESFEKHPNADRLSVCQVNDGEGVRQIVCGAKNFKAGDVVPLALPGATLPAGFTIKPTKMRGEKSEGMLCSAKELEVAEDADGLWIMEAGTPIGKPLKEFVKSETILEIEVTPNRPDLLSYVGLSREMSAIGAERKAFVLPKVEASGSSDWSVRVDEASGCSRYTAQLIEGVKVSESPEWLKARLEAIGLRPINNVVDITNYVLFETGQPLHAFDASKLKGKEIQVRAAMEKETFAALNEKRYELGPDDTVIADASGRVALAGVMGGEESGVTESTVDVLLESALFSKAKVRHTSRRLALISDSSYRFERGIDPVMTDIARDRAIELIIELCQPKSIREVVESSPCSILEKEIPLRLERIEKLLGIRVSEDRVEEILGALGCQRTGGAWKVPSYRPDLEREVDLIEEIARIEGLEKVPSRTALGIAHRSKADRDHDREWDLRNALVGAGFFEMLTNSLRSKVEGEEYVELINPLNQDFAVLRNGLLGSLLPCVAHNLARDQESVKGFEMGTVFIKKGNRAKEERRVCVIATGLDRGTHWSEEGREVDAFTLRGVEDLVKRIWPTAKRSMEAISVPKSALKKYGIKVPVYALEMTLPGLPEEKAVLFSPLSDYPAVKRDLAFLVGRDVMQGSIEDAISGCKISELEEVECFDLFVDDTGEKLSSDKKSLAYTLTFRSTDRTLKESDVKEFEKRIVGQVSKKTGATLRDK